MFSRLIVFGFAFFCNVFTLNYLANQDLKNTTKKPDNLSGFKYCFQRQIIIM